MNVRSRIIAVKLKFRGEIYAHAGDAEHLPSRDAKIYFFNRLADPVKSKCRVPRGWLVALVATQYMAFPFAVFRRSLHCDRSEPANRILVIEMR